MEELFASIRFDGQEPIYLQLVHFVKACIAAGRLQDGDELLSRRALAALLGINPMTVQKAYRIMEEEGFLATSANSGSVVAISEIVAGQIKADLCRSQVVIFIQAMQAMQMDFKSVIDLISEHWEEQEKER